MEKLSVIVLFYSNPVCHLVMILELDMRGLYTINTRGTSSSFEEGNICDHTLKQLEENLNI